MALFAQSAFFFPVSCFLPAVLIEQDYALDLGLLRFLHEHNAFFRVFKREAVGNDGGKIHLPGNTLSHTKGASLANFSVRSDWIASSTGTLSRSSGPGSPKYTMVEHAPVTLSASCSASMLLVATIARGAGTPPLISATRAATSAA